VTKLQNKINLYLLIFYNSNNSSIEESSINWTPFVFLKFKISSCTQTWLTPKKVSCLQHRKTPPRFQFNKAEDKCTKWSIPKKSTMEVDIFFIIDRQTSFCFFVSIFKDFDKWAFLILGYSWNYSTKMKKKFLFITIATTDLQYPKHIFWMLEKYYQLARQK